jgi:1-acyl-sn-glycerol-3-phosphate acyltransferase
MVINCILLLPIRVVLIGSLCILFWIISRLVFFGMDENKQTFKHLSGFRRSIYNSVGILSRIGLFFGGFYSIKRFHISQKQLDKVRATDLKIKKQNIEQTTEPYTIVCNHVSMMDTVVLLSEFNTICFLALERLKSTTLFGEWMKQINCLVILVEIF